MSYVGLLLCLCACSDDEAPGTVPWADQRTQVIDTDRKIVDAPTPEGDACLIWAGGGDVKPCIRPQDECDGQAADVVVNAEGELLDVICYPAEGTLSVEQIEAADGNIRQNQNNSVLVLDGVDDGVDLKGDLAIDGNNVVVYGEGPDTSVIEGKVTVDGNNTIVRGVRIQGDVEVVKNGAVFSLCVIEGNLIVTANNLRVVGCDVFGDVVVRGNNTELYGNRFAGDVDNQGSNLSCDSNLRVEDANEDRLFSEEEIASAEPVACSRN